jgi:nitrate/TMAO reductase-like tetraheme cytochrome c subunit
MHFQGSLLSIVALACAGASALILVGYLVLRPRLGHATKIWLALGLGVFPIGAAAAGNVQGFEATKERRFCGSCHVMSLHAQDADDASSHSLAARHARNRLFGDENCYTCHADYGMFGTIVTKAGGMRHVWLYYTEYRNTPLDEAKRTIVLRKPYPNDNCMQCHSTEVPLWQEVTEHRAMLADLRAERVSCASAGCHGLAHPFFTPPAPSAPEQPRGVSP